MTKSQYCYEVSNEPVASVDMRVFAEGKPHIEKTTLSRKFFLVLEAVPNEPEPFIVCYVPYAGGHGEQTVQKIVKALNAIGQ